MKVVNGILIRGIFFENSLLQGHVQVREDGKLEFRRSLILEIPNVFTFDEVLIVETML